MAAINVAGVRGDLCGAVRWIKAIHVAGVRGDPCGAVRWKVQSTALQVSPQTPATCIAATSPGLIVRILNSAFFK